MSPSLRGQKRPRAVMSARHSAPEATSSPPCVAPSSRGAPSDGCGYACPVGSEAGQFASTRKRTSRGSGAARMRHERSRIDPSAVYRLSPPRPPPALWPMCRGSAGGLRRSCRYASGFVWSQATAYGANREATGPRAPAPPWTPRSGRMLGNRRIRIRLPAHQLDDTGEPSAASRSARAFQRAKSSRPTHVD